MSLQFGLNEYPESAKAVWGARLIFPDDLLHDRQSWIGRDTPDGQALREWLDGGALRSALRTARNLADRLKLKPGSFQMVALHEDEVGVVLGNPRASHGYLYICAYLKEPPSAPSASAIA